MGKYNPLPKDMNTLLKADAIKAFSESQPSRLPALFSFAKELSGGKINKSTNVHVLMNHLNQSNFSQFVKTYKAAKPIFTRDMGMYEKAEIFKWVSKMDPIFSRLNYANRFFTKGKSINFERAKITEAFSKITYNHAERISGLTQQFVKQFHNNRFTTTDFVTLLASIDIPKLKALYAVMTPLFNDTNFISLPIKVKMLEKLSKLRNQNIVPAFTRAKKHFTNKVNAAQKMHKLETIIAIYK
jgi:hypothetical protein